MKNKKKYTLTAIPRPYCSMTERCDCQDIIRITIDAENIFDAQRQFKSIAKELIEKQEEYSDNCYNNCWLDITIDAYKLQTSLFDNRDFKLSKYFEELFDNLNGCYSEYIEKDPELIPLLIAQQVKDILRHIALKTTYSNKVKTDEMIRVRESLAELTLNDLCPDVSPDAKLDACIFSFNLYIFKFYRYMLREMRYHKKLNETCDFLEPKNYLDFQENCLFDSYLKEEPSMSDLFNRKVVA